MKPQQSHNSRPNCFSCRHLYITHETAHPYGCRAMGFKSKNSPALTVFQSSGMECQLFEKKGGK